MVLVAYFSTTCEEDIIRADYLKVKSCSYRVKNIIAGKYSSNFLVAFIWMVTLSNFVQRLNS